MNPTLRNKLVGAILGGSGAITISPMKSKLLASHLFGFACSLAL